MKRKDVLPPTQDHLHVRGIVEGVVITDDGTLAKAMEVSPVDLVALGPQEAARRRASFERAIAALRYPLSIQIVIATRPQTCREYLAKLKARASQLAQRAALSEDPRVRERRERTAERALRWAAFIEAQLTYIRPLEEQYLIVVWYNPFPVKTRRRVLTREKFEQAKEELLRRFHLVMEIMRTQGELEVRELTEQELLAVMYRFYHWSLSPLGMGELPAVRSVQAMQSSLLVGGGNGDHRY